MKQYFLRGLKEAGIVHVKWKSGAEMTSDMFTKNLPTASFEKHKKAFMSSEESDEDNEVDNNIGNEICKNGNS